MTCHNDDVNCPHVLCLFCQLDVMREPHPVPQYRPHIVFAAARQSIPVTDIGISTETRNAMQFDPRASSSSSSSSSSPPPRSNSSSSSSSSSSPPPYSGPSSSSSGRPPHSGSSSSSSSSSPPPFDSSSSSSSSSKQYIDMLFAAAIACRAGNRVLMVDPKVPVYKACAASGLQHFITHDERNCMFMSTLAMDLREAWDKIPVEIQSAWNAYAPKATIKSTDFKNWIGNTAGNCAEFMSDDAAQYALYAARKLGLNCTSYDNRLFETAALAKTEMDQIQTALNGMLTAALRA